VIATIPIPRDFEHYIVAITPNGVRAYVTSPEGAVTVIDTATNTVLTTIPLAMNFYGLAITPDGTRAYVSNPNNHTISVIDTGTNTVVTNFPTVPCPIKITMMPAPLTPRSKKDCQNGGYLNFGPPAGPFENQGQCINYVKTH
jgi:YVTN family beta-propeller protein